MAKFINPNLKYLCQSAFKDDKIGVLLEGSSRSSKTWGSVDFLILLCSKVETGATINIVKETYNSFKTTLFEDFDRRFPMHGIASPTAGKKDMASFFLFGNKINFLGADSDSVLHGVGSDYVYFNEMLNIPKKVFDQMEQRCRKFWWGDYNPNATEHWVYNNVENRPDVGFLKTTFLDNPFISKNERRKLLSYEPTHPDDRHLPRERRRPHPVNIKSGTADEFMWNVYGLGLRSAPEGLIFQDVDYIDEFPTNIEKIYWGSDIGKTVSPSTVVKIGISKLATIDEPGDMFIECLGYRPTPSPREYCLLLKECGISKNTYMWIDSAEPGYISAARSSGFPGARAVNKFQGSIMYGIGVLKNYRLHIVKNQFYEQVKKEQTNYKYREVHGIKLDEPIDEHNHFWDGTRYAAMSNLKLVG